MSAALIGTYSFKGPFRALSTRTLSAGAAAAGLAQVNATGNLAGLGGTALTGVIRNAVLSGGQHVPVEHGGRTGTADRTRAVVAALPEAAAPRMA
ncbi:MAG: hypothetical protein ACRYHQ_14600 [Janthinobacterium lividum]